MSILTKNRNLVQSNLETELRKMFFLTIFTISFILHAEAILAVNISGNLDTSNIIIQFNPRVSILDAYDPNRYSYEELVPLVSLVATRFTKMFLPYDCSDLSIYELSAIATAHYNCLNSTKIKIELILTFECDKYNYDCRGTPAKFKAVTKFADKVNELCNETIRTIVLERTLKNSLSSIGCGQVLDINDRYNLGERLCAGSYCNPNEVWNSTILPAVVVLYFRGNSIDVSNCNPYRTLTLTTHNPVIVKQIVMSDTFNYIPNNITNVVNFWEKVTHDRGYEHFLHQAFDTWDHKTKRYDPTGWWYLKKDPGTTNTSQFLFEEKVQVADEIDMKENPEFLHWYRETPFNRNTTGIIFQGHFSNYSEKVNFCRVMCIEELDDLKNVKRKAAEIIAQCGERFELILLLKKIYQKDLTELYELREHITILESVESDVLGRIADASFLKTVQEFGFKRGYYVNMDYCGEYNRLNMSFKEILQNAFTDSKSSIYIFHFEEDENRVNLGATSMFRVRNVLFDLCTKLLFTTRNMSTEVGFAVKAFYKYSNFYQSSWAMKNYLRYVNLMSEWGENQPNTVIFLGQDEDRTFNRDKLKYQTVGWYSYDKFVENNGYKLSNNKLLYELAMPSSESEYDTSLVLSNVQLVMVIFSIVIFIISLVIISICFIRRYKKKFVLPHQETEIFFMGRSCEDSGNIQDPNDIPYDMEKYEIPQDNFTIDMSKLLGSGEFGMVCRGTVHICDEDIQVAVKTTNPRKFNETSLKSLLSEIKILSHVGQHPNIIKIFGANTSNLRTGKVYVFLELCHLGSLLSVLRKLGTSSRTSITNASNFESEDTTKYVNINSGQDCILDESLSNDLFRWSKEICSGMAYLAEKHVVHADLATRNVLLNLRHEAKICDFGLSRRMFNYESYVKSQQEPLPWKWLAPESLRYMQFDEKTDVWSYGVTLWELYSLGSVPYAGLSWDANFVQMLEGGLVLSKPDFEEKNMYKIMQDCWKIVAGQRPSFAQILSRLDVPNLGNDDNSDKE